MHIEKMATPCPVPCSSDLHSREGARAMAISLAGGDDSRQCSVTLHHSNEACTPI